MSYQKTQVIRVAVLTKTEADKINTIWDEVIIPKEGESNRECLKNSIGLKEDEFDMDVIDDLVVMGPPLLSNPFYFNTLPSYIKDDLNTTDTGKIYDMADKREEEPYIVVMIMVGSILVGVE